MLHDAHRAGWKSYAAGQQPPSMKPRGMSDADWQRWLRGWYDAQDEHQNESMALHNTPTRAAAEAAKKGGG